MERKRNQKDPKVKVRKPMIFWEASSMWHLKMQMTTWKQAILPRCQQHPSREELERLQAENQKLQARMNEIQEQLRLALESTKPSVAPRDEKPKDKPLATPKEMPKPATRPRARAANMAQQRPRSREPTAVPRHPAT